MHPVRGERFKQRHDTQRKAVYQHSISLIRIITFQHVAEDQAPRLYNFWHAQFS